MKDFGYLLVVNGENSVYYDMANLLALSIKRTQPSGYDNVCIVSEKSETYNRFVYDKFIVKTNQEKGWDQRNLMFDISPYKHTICLDSDMYFTKDISHWVDHFINDSYGLYINKNVTKYNGDEMTNLHCRPTYKENKLPLLYSGFTYFNKESAIANDFFDLVKAITYNKELFRNRYLTKGFPPEMGTDEVFSLAAKLLNIEEKISYDMSFPKFAHLKYMLQDVDISSIAKDLGIYFNDTVDVTIGNHRQYDIIHYSDKEFPLNEMTKVYRELMFKGIKHG